MVAIASLLTFDTQVQNIQRKEQFWLQRWCWAKEDLYSYTMLNTLMKSIPAFTDVYYYTLAANEF